MNDDETLRVQHLGADRFEVKIRQHTLYVDQPVGAGGSDSAPTPTETFVASLASCVAFYVRRFLTRHGLPTEGLEVEARFTMSSKPARVGEILVLVHAEVPDDQRAALLAVASHCTVHNSLVRPPEVQVALSPTESTVPDEVDSAPIAM
jgi:putative redox protein